MFKALYQDCLFESKKAARQFWALSTSPFRGFWGELKKIAEK